MTALVETGGQLIAMTAPVEQGAGGTMRFFLPRAVAEAGAPEPAEAGVQLVDLPAERMAALGRDVEAAGGAGAAQAGARE